MAVAPINIVFEPRPPRVTAQPLPRVERYVARPEWRDELLYGRGRSAVRLPAVVRSATLSPAPSAPSDSSSNAATRHPSPANSVTSLAPSGTLVGETPPLQDDHGSAFERVDGEPSVAEETWRDRLGLWLLACCGCCGR